MKKMFRYLGMALALTAGLSCTRENLPEVHFRSGAIKIDVSSMPHTKITDAELESKGPEAYVNHLDLFIFGEQAAEDGQVPSNTYHERITFANPASPEAKTLGLNKDSFVLGRSYDIYVVANSTATRDVMAAVTSASDLETLVQTDNEIHLSGLNLENVPSNFLMDAHQQVVINPVGGETEDITVSIKLTRAAAKVVVELFEGSAEVNFQSPDNSHIYHFTNIAYSTAVLPVAHSPKVRSTEGESLNGYVNWNVDATGAPQISITGYVYAYDYSSENLDKHSSLVINIPLKIGIDDYPVNYYKIPLTSDLKFERNKMYRIRANVNAPGAQTSFEPLELKNLQYTVTDWEPESVKIPVGNSSSKPSYLQLNLDHVDIYNLNRNQGTLRFSSSSYITSIVLEEAYYYDAYDQKVLVNSSDPSVYSAINAQADANVLSGGITIFSPFVKEGSIQDSHKNTIRYMTFRVENQDGKTAKFTVSQYPTLYITNEHGKYSYREDFTGNTSGVAWNSSSLSWSYSDDSSSAGFFSSKEAAKNGNNYTIYYANWRNGSIQRDGNTGTFNNPRMYHVHVTATSSDYIVAKPKLDSKGFTERSEDNSKLVSPSFFIASQLGATQTSTSIEIDKAERHCQQYIEVSEGNVYKDWRLPTKAEIDIIRLHQHTSPAMAEVMNGSHYYCSYNPEYAGQTGSRANWIYTVRDIGNSMGGVHVRCVHDAYSN